MDVSGVVYDTVVFDLNWIQFGFQIQQTFTTFDPTMNILTLKCEGADDYIAQCMAALDKIRSASSPVCLLMLIFYKESNAVLVQKSSMDVFSSVFTSALVEVSKTSINFVLKHNSSIFPQPTDLHFTIINRLNSDSWVPDDLQINQSFTGNTTTVSYSCPSSNAFC